MEITWRPSPGNDGADALEAAYGSAMPSPFEQTRLEGNKLFLYQAKTGVPVYVPLPP